MWLRYVVGLIVLVWVVLLVCLALRYVGCLDGCWFGVLVIASGFIVLACLCYWVAWVVMYFGCCLWV